MTTAEIKSNAFTLHRSADMIVIAKRRENVADGIVTGIIVNVLVLPLLLVALLVGVLGLVVAVTREHSLLLVLLGVMFAGGAVLLLRFFLKFEFVFFPYECRLKRTADGGWAVQQKLWFVAFPWKRLSRDWTILCYPVYLRGDWGYALFIRSGRTTLRVASSGAYADSKHSAEHEARKDLAELCNLFAVSGELKRWD